MRFETKLLLILTFSITVLLSSINIVVIVYIRDFQVNEKDIQDFSRSLMLWEAVLIFIVLLLFRYVIQRYVSKEVYNKFILNVILLHITHKIGNFIAKLKINLELLEDNPVKKRIKLSLKDLEEEYKRTINLLDEIDKYQKPTHINLKFLIENVITELGQETSRIKTVLSDLHIRAEEHLLRIMFQSLLENAMKYSKKTVYIKVCSKGKLVVIRNDISGVESNWSPGMGLEIAKLIAEYLGANIKIKIKKCFTVFVLFH